MKPSRTILLASLFTILAAVPVLAADKDNGFKSIFNGRDLSGWDAQEGSWEVRDGAITCTGSAPSKNWVIYRGNEELGDFILRLKFKYGKGNSGVQVRSDDLGEFQVQGSQVEVAEREKMGLWHHSLLPKDDPAKETRHFLATAGQKVVITAKGKKTVEQVADPVEVQKSFVEDGWNSLVVIARGPRLVQRINGVVYAELIDRHEGYARNKGVIALQDHGKGCIVAFKDIELKELGAQ
ncbi:MAG: DUF1080 domain-containing protein [Verrucomicrobiales bacterium]